MNKKQVFNPYLPLYEYIPDGEPHVFDGRVYVYGSHDHFGAFDFCFNDYVTWSAPLDDLSDWRYEGVIFRKNQDPMNPKGKRCLFAPDVCRAKDGKYYLFYAFDWLGLIGVAVSDSPAGPFEYHGLVHYPNGELLGREKDKSKRCFQFDPGVLVDDDGRAYLYTGFGCVNTFPQILPTGGKVDGCYAMELGDDMLTIVDGPRKVLGKKTQMNGTPFEGHEFFEASTIRKFNGKYYLGYSSINGHELCYSVGDTPYGPFEYKGTLVSNGDVFLNGRAKKDAVNPLGNTHGVIVKVGDDYYVFYHRHTNFTNTDRQGCAEKLELDENGDFKQAECTCCGLNGGPLKGVGEYPASICSKMLPKKGNIFYPFFAMPWQKGNMMITQSGKDEDTVETQYIKNINDGGIVGYKYFDLKKTKEAGLELDGNFKGEIVMKLGEEELGKAEVALKKGEKQIVKIAMKPSKEIKELTFTFNGKGKANFYKLILA